MKNTKNTKRKTIKKESSKIRCRYCLSDQYVKSGFSRGLPIYKCKECKRTWVYDKVKAIKCCYCQENKALQIQIFRGCDRRTKKIYECYGCHKTTEIVDGSVILSNKEIHFRSEMDIEKKLRAWSKKYLDSRSESKQYEPMLYFLDLYKKL